MRESLAPPDATDGRRPLAGLGRPLRRAPPLSELPARARLIRRRAPDDDGVIDEGGKHRCLPRIRKAALVTVALAAFGLGGSRAGRRRRQRLVRLDHHDGHSPGPTAREALSSDVAAKVERRRSRRCRARPCSAPRRAGRTTRPTTRTSGHPTGRSRSYSSTPRSRRLPSRRTTVAAQAGGGGPGGGETPLTGDTKTKVEAAVLAKYPGATILSTETNGDSTAPYESHVRTTTGTQLEVLVSASFAVLEAREHPARP